MLLVQLDVRSSSQFLRFNVAVSSSMIILCGFLILAFEISSVEPVPTCIAPVIVVEIDVPRVFYKKGLDEIRIVNARIGLNGILLP